LRVRETSLSSEFDRKGGGAAEREIVNGDIPRAAATDAEMRKRAFDRWENEGGKVLPNPKERGGSTRGEGNNDSVQANRGSIKMHLRKVEQLFDSLDHSPFREKDLDRNAEEYIVESIKELPSKAGCEIVIYLDERIESDAEKNAIKDAIHIHFSRRAQVSQQKLRQLLRRGWISLGIGLSFLITFYLLGQFIREISGERQWTTLLHESLLIGGWVAMWKPLEIFLYDWWPLVGERRLYTRLSRIQIQIIQTTK
jgi:hypothetical protein